MPDLTFDEYDSLLHAKYAFDNIKKIDWVKRSDLTWSDLELDDLAITAYPEESPPNWEIGHNKQPRVRLITTIMENIVELRFRQSWGVFLINFFDLKRRSRLEVNRVIGLKSNDLV